jgi:hypothetical protein
MRVFSTCLVVEFSEVHGSNLQALVPDEEPRGIRIGLIAPLTASRRHKRDDQT